MVTRENMTIRPFRPADSPAVHKLLLETVDGALAGTYAPSAVRHFKKHHDVEEILGDAAGGYAVVLECAGEVVATGMLVDGEIKRVYVHPDCQRRGLGRRIMAHLEARALAAGLKSVRLHSTIVARPFYESLGYGLTEAKCATMEDGQPLEYFEMTKHL